jgi:hypothetical protein
MTSREREMAVNTWAERNRGLASILTPVVTSLLTLLIVFVVRATWPGFQVATLHAEIVTVDTAHTRRQDSTNVALAADEVATLVARRGLEARADLTLAAVCTLMTDRQKERVLYLGATCHQLLNKAVP